MAASRPETESVEVDLLLEAVFRRYGFDFRDYARASVKRRIWKRAHAENVRTISGLQERVLHDTACMERLLLDLSVHVTDMFRDPGFFLAFRRKVVPVLRTYPFIRIWNAGCSSGEEVYSVAILMQEEGLYDRCRIYATDMNEAVLHKAKEGILPLKSMQQHTGNYQKAGGKKSFSEYYTAKYDNAILRPSLRENVVFSQHNLVTDGSFNEFNVVLCRNVMIYFGKELQARVHGLLHESLCTFGYLGVGRRESLKFTPHEGAYEQVDPEQRIYRRVA
jgi:chemotaxis protein methyltransferase CheR